MNMTAKTPAERQADYYKRQIERGFKQVTVWVPATLISALHKFVKSLRISKP